MKIENTLAADMIRSAAQTQWNSPWRIIASEWRQSWRVGLAAFFGTAVSIAVWPSISSLFVRPLHAAFGWSRGEIALAANTTFIGVLLAPLLGRVIDRLGVRSILLPGILFTALSYFAFAAMTGTRSGYYLIYACLTIFGTTTSGITYTRVVAAAFTRSRGFALAVNRAGFGLSGMILPSLVFLIIATWGWRWAFVFMGMLMLAVAFPLTWLFLRQAPTGKQPPLTAQSGVKRASLREVLGNRKALFLCLGAGLNYAPVVAVLSQLQPLLIDKGLASTPAASLVGLAGAAALIGGLIAGFLADRIHAPSVAGVSMLAPILGCFLLMPGASSLSFAAVAVMLFGVGQGVELDLVAFMVARYFDMRHYSLIYGMTYLSLGVLAGVGVSAMGLLYDHFGNYQLALYICMGSFLGAAICYLAMGGYPNVGEPAPHPV